MVAPYFNAPPPPTSAQPLETLRSTAGWATAAKVTVGLTMAATLGTAGTAFALARSWAGWDEGTIEFEELVAAENLYGGATLLYLVVQVAAWVCVITWLYRAAQNAKRINPGRMNNAPKWAIWGWFVPFMNWVRPYHMVKETWEASDRADTTPTPTTLFKLWWALVLASGVVFQFTSFTRNLDSQIAALYIEVFADLAYLAGGVLFIKIIGMTTERQANATLLLSAPIPPMPEYVLPEADQRS